MPPERKARYPAAFINCIVDEGNKDEAVYWLQVTWDELCALRSALVKFGYTNEQIAYMIEKGEPPS